VAHGVPAVLETHVPWSFHAHLEGYRRLFATDALRAVVVVSTPLAQNLAANGFPAERVLVEPDGVDLHQYPEGVTRQEARARVGLAPEAFTVVYTGHLHRDRGLETALASARRLPEISFVFVGGWPKDVEHYRQVAQGQENVRFVGSVEHARVPDYQFAADVLLMQYSGDTHHAGRCSPLKLFEYMAAARPMVSTDLPVLHEVLRHEENALLVAPDSEAALSAAIVRLREERSLADALARTARAESLGYTWDARARRILSKALPDRQRPSPAGLDFPFNAQGV